VVFESAIPEQLRQQAERMVSQHLIDERLLPFKCFQCTATRNSIVIQGWIGDFWK
jgi:hypothetical protein